MGEAKRRRLLGDVPNAPGKIMHGLIERAVQEVFDQPIVLPIGVGTGTEPALHCHNNSRTYVAQHGGELVHGFWIEPTPRRGDNGGHRFGFIHHTLVRGADGQLIDPSYRPGQAKFFVEDPSRPYDYERQIGWNNMSVVNVTFRCIVTGQTIPTWKPVWSTMVDTLQIYSVRPEHARRRHFKEGDGINARAWVVSLGLDPDDPINAFYTTNVELSQSEMCEVMRHILKLA